MTCLSQPFPKCPEPPSIAELEIASSNIELLEKLGEGNFGHVRRGLVNNIEVAVKTIKTITLTKKNIANPNILLLEEADKMRKLFHPNLCHLICVAIDSDPALMVLEFMNKGSLESCLKDDEFVRQEVNLNFVLLCLKEIASGMAYLSEQNPPVLHRDLRTANVLIHDEKRHLDFKIADFGLTQELMGNDQEYFQGNNNAEMPIFWLSPEVLTYQNFSVKSDVWSFGILAFEVFTLAAVPYRSIGLKSMDEVKQFVKSGKTLTFEDCIKSQRQVENFDEKSICPEPLFEEVEKCWKFEPADRPQFSALNDFLYNYDSGYQYD